MDENIANSIPMTEILSKLGFEPSNQDAKSAMYLSPLRDERTPSFHVTFSRNEWFDFGNGRGGGPRAFVYAWLKHTGADCSKRDIDRWFEKMAFLEPREVPFLPKEKISGWTNILSYNLSDIGLQIYMKSRGINVEFARQHVKEVRAQSVKTGKFVIAIGFKNEEGGYELRNSYIKGCVSPKSVTFIRGNGVNKPCIHVFEGFFDYLTFLTRLNGAHDGDALVINSTSLVKEACGYIKGMGYKQVYTYLHNDLAGNNATKTLRRFLDSEPSLKFIPQNEKYKSFKDLNEMHVFELKHMLG